ncbi:MAG TPA: hypothetical protein VMN77_03380 [Nitrospiria bacterium]|nr:hypothetical protein [Nitrospiria bacterium]
MKTGNSFLRHFFVFAPLLYTLTAVLNSPEAGATERMARAPIRLAQVTDNPQTNSNLLVELFLARERKADLDTIKKAFGALGVTRIRPQFFRLGNPPENIAIGKDVPADVARLAIRLAVEYNRDIKYLLPEYRFFPDQIVIGSSAYDEKSQIPIRPEDLEKLSDPALTTREFHELYRHLTGEDKRLPTYLK